MKPLIFKGVGTAMITPMKEDGSINYPVYDSLLEMQLAGDADAIVVTGTTGEVSTLSEKEHIELVRHTVRYIHGRIPVIAGAGSNNTAHAAHLSLACEKAGADALLHVTPYYNKASQHGLLLHFNECARATSLPIILYNAPSRTGVNIQPDTCKRLSETKNITAIKEASGNLEQIAEIISLCGDDLAVYAGNDDQTTACLSMGAAGVISVLSNLVPKDSHAMCSSYFHQDYAAGESLQLHYRKLIDALFMDVNPIPVKQALRAMGYDVGHCRLPLCDMDAEMTEKLYIVLKDYNLIN